LKDLAACIEKETPDGLKLRVRVQPRASKNAIGDIREGSLRVRLTSPPVDGSANKQLIAFLSKKLKIAKSRITLSAGEKARVKRLFLADVSLSLLEKKLEETE